MSELPIEELPLPRLRDFLEATVKEGDEAYALFEGLVLEVKLNKAPTLEFITAHITTFEHHRGQMARRQWITTRRLNEARDVYFAKLRKSKARGPMGKSAQLAYEERLATYETEHIVDLSKMELLARAQEECKSALFYMDKKLWWLQNLRVELRYRADQERYASGKDYQN